jgi:hypothetical protein
VAERSVLGFMMRYHPALRALAEADWSDAYGFHFEIGHDVRQWRKNWRFADSYAARAEGGGRASGPLPRDRHGGLPVSGPFWCWAARASDTRSFRAWISRRG